MVEPEDPAEERLARRAVAARLARGSFIQSFPDDPDGVMHTMTQEAQLLLGRRALLLRVDDGFPELFTVTGLPVTPVAVSSRYLDVAFAIRELLINEALSGVREGFFETLALRVTSEVLMRQGSYDWGTYTFLRGLVGQSLFVDLGESITRLDSAPKDEGTLTSLFFGMLHELGHSASDEFTDQFGPLGYLSDEAIIDWVRLVVDEWRAASGLDLPAVPAAAFSDDRHPLNAALLRSEIRADLFAITALVRASHRAMAAPGRPFDLNEFFAEPTLAVAPLWFLTICRDLAAHLSRGGSNTAEGLRMLFRPVPLNVRLFYLHEYVSVWSSSWGGWDLDWEATRGRFDDASAVLSDPLRELDRGLNGVIRFVLMADERPPAGDLLEQVVPQADGDEWTRHEIAQHCRLANAVNAPRDSFPLQVLDRLAGND